MCSLKKQTLPRCPKQFSVATSRESRSCSFTPVSWSRYFDTEKKVHVKEDAFQVYLSGKSGPVLVLIHGGGYSALTWAMVAEEISKTIECQILALDLRGHGNSRTDDEENLSLEVLTEDVVNVLATFYDHTDPAVVLIGHSLGGAVAVAASALIPNTIGICIIDVVEETALKSLSAMQSVLRKRPSGFNSVENAIQWCFRTGQTLNLEAARISMPGQIINLTTGRLATDDCTLVKNDTSTRQVPIDTITEEVEEVEVTETPPTFKMPEEHCYTWRIDLSRTEPYWKGWFQGLSQKFLDIQTPKVLLLANIHGLDTALTVGQMQGKFQLQVLPRSGHAIHEDQPQHVANVIAGFLVKHNLAAGKDGFTPTLFVC